MKCPECGGKTTVIESHSELGKVYRQRKCKNCFEVAYTTEETMQSSMWDFMQSRCRYKRKNKINKSNV